MCGAASVAVCVCAGGIAAVIYTDSLQTIIMVGGALALMFICMLDAHQQDHALLRPKITDFDPFHVCLWRTTSSLC